MHARVYESTQIHTLLHTLTHTHTHFFLIPNLAVQQLEIGGTSTASLGAGHSNSRETRKKAKMPGSAHTETDTHAYTQKCRTRSAGNKSWELRLGCFLVSFPPEWSPH